jgi:hypothetical protein
VFDEMDNNSSLVNRLRCLISYMNVVVLIIQIQSTILNELAATFVSLGGFLYSCLRMLPSALKFS